MADIFLSYASEDRSAAARLVAELEPRGYSVWWDRQLIVGGSFDRQIEAEIDQSRCVLVLWSERSLDSDWVRAEAGEGLERGRLVQVLLEPIRPPLVFRQQQAFAWHEGEDLGALFAAIDSALNRTGSSPDARISQSLWLVADFDNQTEMTELSGTLAEACGFGLDYLAEVFLYPRDALRSLAERDRALLPVTLPLAEREGLDYVLGGTVRALDTGLELTVLLEDLRAPERHRRSLEVTEGRTVIEVLAELVGDLVTGAGAGDGALVCERIGRLDIGCLHQDLLGAGSQAEHEHERALDHFQRALELDPGFVPSCIGLAISYDCLGMQEQSREAMARTLEHLDGLSARERHRTQAMYYMYASENYRKALEHLTELARISPLEAPNINNLALARCNMGDFQGAVETLTRAVNLAPDEPFYQVNLALYCLYASQLDRTVELAGSLLAAGQQMGDLYLALACARFAMGDSEGARGVYEQLLRSADPTDRWLLSSARIGLADQLMAVGRMDDAATVLEGIPDPAGSGDQLDCMAHLMRADILAGAGEQEQARVLISAVVDDSTEVRVLADAGIGAAALGDQACLERISARLNRRLDSQARAYALMIEGLSARLAGDFVGAEQALRGALEISDLWMIHLQLADLYQALDMALEDRLELDACRTRAGEGTTAYVNRIPTCRYLARARRSR